MGEVKFEIILDQNGAQAGSAGVPKPAPEAAQDHGAPADACTALDAGPQGGALVQAPGACPGDEEALPRADGQALARRRRQGHEIVLGGPRAHAPDQSCALEVHQERAAVRVEEDVAGVEVRVPEPGLLEGDQGPGQLLQPLRGELRVVAEELVQGAGPADGLHAQLVGAVATSEAEGARHGQAATVELGEQVVLLPGAPTVEERLQTTGVMPGLADDAAVLRAEPNAAERAFLEGKGGVVGHRAAQGTSPEVRGLSSRAVTLQLYVLRQLLVSIGFSLAGIGVIVLPTIAIQAIHKLGAVSLGAVVGYLPLVVVELVPYLLPMSFLLGVVATFGRLAAERELVAIRMAGIHPARVTLPALGLAVVFALVTDYLVSEVSPEWKYQRRNFVRMAEMDVLENLPVGETQFQFGTSSLQAERNPAKGVFEGVLLDLALEGRNQTVTAERVRLDVREGLLVLELTEAHFLNEDAKVSNRNPTYSVPLERVFPDRTKSRDRPKYHPSSRLRRQLATGEHPGAEPEEIVYEIQARHALSATYLLFLLLGVPTGIVLRSGTQLGAFTGAIGYAFLYYVLALRLGKELAGAGAVPPGVAAWSTDLLFLVVGGFLFVRTLWR